MGQQLYNLVNSGAFWVLVVIWFIILVVWRDRWLGVLTRSTNLISKPVIFTHDPNPENVKTYPRSFFEETARAFRNTLTEPFNQIIKTLHDGLAGLVKIIYNPEHPFRTIGYILLLILFCLLVYSDAVAVANTLLVLNLSTAIPPFLNSFDLAVFSGSLIALILGFAFLFETMSNNSEFTPMSDREPRIRKFMFAYSLFICLLSITSLVAWGLARFSVVENQQSSMIDNFVTFVVVFVVPFNSALAAALIFNEAIRGIVVLIAGIGYGIEGLLYILNWLLNILGSLVPFLFDLIYRIIHILVDVFLWIITTPVLALFLPFVAIYKLVVGADNGSVSMDPNGNDPQGQGNETPVKILPEPNPASPSYNQQSELIDLPSGSLSPANRSNIKRSK